MRRQCNAKPPNPAAMPLSSTRASVCRLGTGVGVGVATGAALTDCRKAALWKGGKFASPL